jgi:hypothetical protein
MIVLTKATDITWVSLEAQVNNPELNTERDAKLLEMVTEEKTDGNPEVISEIETRREFVDQAAAEEYRDFIWSMDAKYGPGIVLSIQIVDAT